MPTSLFPQAELGIFGSPKDTNHKPEMQAVNDLFKLVSISLNTFAELLTATATQVAVGEFVFVHATGGIYKRVSSGGHLGHTASTLLWQVMPGPTGYTTASLGVPTDGVTDARLALVAAIGVASANGQFLDWGNFTYTMASPLATTTAEVKWLANGAKIIYTGADTLSAVLVIVGVGKDHQIRGSGFSVDAGSKAHIGLRIYQTATSQTASFYGENIEVKNVDGIAAMGEGSAGLQVYGGYKSVTLASPKVSNVRLRTGVGVPGTLGVQGISIVSGGAGKYAVKTEIITPVVDRVYSQDPAYSVDMDGIGVFANPDVDISGGASSARIVNSRISRCWGRDVKTQVFDTYIENPHSLRSEGPSGGIANAAYDIQSGSGQVVGGNFEIAGVACTTEGVLVRFSCGEVASPMASTWIGGHVLIRSGATVVQIASHDSVATPKKAASLFSGQSVSGSVRNFLLIRTNGLDNDIASLNGVLCTTLTDALVRVETSSGGTAPYRARVLASGCIHMNATLVSLVRANVSGLASRALHSELSCIGFAKPLATFSAADALSGGITQISALYPDELRSSSGAIFLSGSARMISITLTSAETYTLPAHGSGGYTAEFTMSATETHYAKVSVGSGGMVSIYSGAGANIGTTSDPGSGDLRIWRSGGQLVVKNGNASTRTVTVLFFG